MNMSGEAYVYTNVVVLGQILNAQYIEVCRNTFDYRKARVYNNVLVCGDVKICGKVKLYRKAVLCDAEDLCNNEKNSTYSHIPYGVKEENGNVSGKACIDFITLFVLLEVPYFLYFGSINMSQIIGVGVWI
ncbi:MULTISPECIES: hypothetical protein [Bartonella]|uniref:hypothetical protein n=1 Tax=Bartonella TaxID=773 RepID=UPI00235EBF25|nr:MULTISPECIES: hypothetical protein [Bartonella]